MSSQGYQFVKKTRKFHMNPESTGEQVISSMKFGSTRTGGADNFAISSQGASASGKREMNLVSSGNSGDGILFSGRGTASGASKMQLQYSAYPNPYFFQKKFNKIMII